jgi:hypothetical protein
MQPHVLGVFTPGHHIWSSYKLVWEMRANGLSIFKAANTGKYNG